jgi:hypothetical protein
MAKWYHKLSVKSRVYTALLLFSLLFLPPVYRLFAVCLLFACHPFAPHISERTEN